SPNTTPEPTSPPPPLDGFPTEASAGVPAGTKLATYRGPCLIDKDGTVLERVEVACDRLVIQAAGVIVRSSRLPPVDVAGDGWSVTVEDSEIDGGEFVGPAIGYGNVTVRRSEIRGAQHSVLCGSNCLIESSLLHDQFLPTDEDWHNNGFLSNGGTGVRLTGNTISCTPVDNDAGGGCSGAASFFGDFEPVSDGVIESNLIRATPGACCVRLGYDPAKQFGPEGDRVVVIGNIFDRGPAGQCGGTGPVTSAPPGIRFEGNLWSDGQPVPVS